MQAFTRLAVILGIITPNNQPQKTLILHRQSQKDNNSVYVQGIYALPVSKY